MKIGSHLQGYMRAGSMAERAVYMPLQEKQLSRFSPLYIEFCRFSGGSKLNRSPRCRHSLRNDGAKIGILLERCNILSRFFHFGGKYRAKRPYTQVLFCPFRLCLKERLLFFLPNRSLEAILPVRISRSLDSNKPFLLHCVPQASPSSPSAFSTWLCRDYRHLSSTRTFKFG